MANGTDGSVVIYFQAKTEEAQQELAKLRRQIEKVEDNIRKESTGHIPIEEELHAAEQAAAEARNRVDELKAELAKTEKIIADSHGGGPFDFEEYTRAYERQKEITKELKEAEAAAKKLEENVGKYATKASASEKVLNAEKIELEQLKQRYGETMQEAQRYQNEAEKAAQKQSGALSKVRSAAAKHGASIGQSLKSAFSTGTKYARRFASFVGKLLQRFNLLSKFGHTFVPILKRIYNLGRRVFFFSIITAGMRALRETVGELIKGNDKLMASFSQLKGVALTAFQPIYAYIMPALTAFIDTITVAVARLAQFTALLFGTTAEQAQKNAKALNAQAKATEAAGNAAEDAAAGLAGFDEINQLSGGKSGGGSGTSEDAIAPTFDYDFGEVPDWIEEIAAAIRRGDWGAAGKALADRINNLIDGTDWKGIGQSLGEKLQGALSFGLSLLRGLGWGKLGSDIAGLINGAVSKIDPRDIGAWLGQKLRIGIELAFGFVSTFDFAGAGNWLGNVLNGWVAEIDWAKLARAISLGIRGIFTGFGNFLRTVDWREVGRSIGDFIANIDWGGVLGSVWDAVKEAFSGLWEALDGLNERLPGIKTLVLAIGAAFAAWKIGSGVMSILSLFGAGGKKASAAGGGSGSVLGSMKNTLIGVGDIAIVIGGAVAVVEALGAIMKIPGAQKTAEDGIKLIGIVFRGIASIALPLAGMAAAMVVLGKIGVAAVAKGLAGAALVIDGIPALVTLLGALMAIPYAKDLAAGGLSAITSLFEGLGAIALPLGEMTGIIVAMGLATPATMLSGLAGFAAVVAGLELVLAALGGLNQIPGFDWIIGEGGKVLMQLGEILGGFVGSIVGGLLDKVSDSFPAVADNLAQFSEKLKPFFENIKGADADAIDAVGHVAGIIMTLTAAGVLEGLTKWFTGGSNIVKFGMELEAFAPHFVGFYNVIKDIDPDVVKASAAAAQSVAEFARNIPNEGGVLAVLYGENSLAEFGAMLPGFAKDFVAYYNEVKKVTDMSVVEKSSAAAQSIAEFAKNLPNSGGVVSWFTGDNRLDEFGAMLPGFGRNFAEYYNAVKGISRSVVEKSVAAAQSISGFAENIPNSGGLVSFYMGDNRLDEFGKMLPGFGEDFAKYYGFVKEIKTSVVEKSMAAAESISAFATTIPNNGGFFSLFSGDNSLDKFGKQLAGFGYYFSEFYGYISPMSPGKISNMTTAIERTIETAKNAASVDKKALESFGASLSEFGKNLKDTDWEKSGGDFAECVSGIQSSAEGLVRYVQITFATVWAGVWAAAKKNITDQNIAAEIDGISARMGQIPTGVAITITAAVSSAIDNIQSVIDKLAELPTSVNIDLKTTGGGVKPGLNTSGSRPSVISSYAPLNLSKMPRLAQGMVIPPNREFMAVLGDQTSGTNVEAPLDTIKQALVEALRESGGSGSGDIHITLELDGSVVARKTVKHINDMTRQAGKPVLLY